MRPTAERHREWRVDPDNTWTAVLYERQPNGEWLDVHVLDLGSAFWAATVAEALNASMAVGVKRRESQWTRVPHRDGFPKMSPPLWITGTACEFCGSVRWPTVQPNLVDGYVWTDCPDCGPDVRIDEDGCCLTCGADALHHEGRTIDDGGSVAVGDRARAVEDGEARAKSLIATVRALRSSEQVGGTAGVEEMRAVDSAAPEFRTDEGEETREVRDALADLARFVRQGGRDG